MSGGNWNPKLYSHRQSFSNRSLKKQTAISGD